MKAIGRVCVGLLCALVLAGTRASGEPPSPDPVAMAMASVVEWGRKADVLKETALKALENAMAVQQEAGRQYLTALRDGEAAAVRRAEKAVDSAADDVSDARSMTADVVYYVRACTDVVRGAEKAKQAFDGAAGKTRPSDLVDSLKDAAYRAQRQHDKAQRIVSGMKQRWLLPVIKEGGIGSPSPAGRP
jgi:hypothetical protein